MAERYRMYQFLICEKRKAEDDMKFANPDRVMRALEEICQEGVRLKREVHDPILINGVETFYLVGNGVVRNKTSGVSPYCETEIICQGKPTGNIVERYRKFYRSDPIVIPC